jgi:hypothetical protein
MNVKSDNRSTTDARREVCATEMTSEAMSPKAERQNAKGLLESRIRSLRRDGKEQLELSMELEALLGVLPQNLDGLAERGLYRLIQAI